MKPILRSVLFFWCLTLSWQPVTGQQATPAPYLYYYAASDQTYIVERADGTDRRQFGGSVDFQYMIIDGHGWSPSGDWFQYWVHAQSIGGLIRISDGYSSESYDRFTQVNDISWSPDEQVVLVQGRLFPCEQTLDCQRLTYWLIALEQDAVIAWLDFLRGERGAGDTAIEWMMENNTALVRFYEIEARFSEAFSSYYEITMMTDGTVIKRPITAEIWQTMFVDAPVPQQPASVSSPSGRFMVSTWNGSLTDTQTGRTLQIPQATVSDGEAGRVIDAAWSSDEQWVLLKNYIVIRTSGIVVTSIMRTDGSGFRVLSSCGDSPACVGWLPPQVDVSQLAPFP